MSEVEKTPLHKKWWVWVVGILLIIAAINGNKNAWIYLLVDVIVGLTSFIWFHYYNGDFSKLV